MNKTIISFKDLSMTASGLKYIQVEGLEKNAREESLATEFVKKKFDHKIYSNVTLNNWKGENHDILILRYATNVEELKDLLAAIESDKHLPVSHCERSLLYD